jgi:hypothetical protein
MSHRTAKEPQAMDGISSARKTIPRTREPPRHQISRAFVPPCIHGARSDRNRRPWTASLGPASALANRNPRRTLLVVERAKRVPGAAPRLWIMRTAGETTTCALIAGSGARGLLDTTAVACTICEHSSSALPEIDSTTQRRRDNFCSSSRSVRNPDVSRMRARIWLFSPRNSAVCLISCCRTGARGTS